MKKISIAPILLLASMFVLTACSEDEPYLTVSTNSVFFGAKGNGDGYVDVRVDYTGWSAAVTDGAQYFSVSPKSGTESQTIYISATSENKTTEPRIGKVRVTSTKGNFVEEISITQEAGDESLSVDESELEFSAEGETLSFNVKSNSDWQITNDPEWLSVNPSSGNGDHRVNVKVSENTTNDERTCKLSIELEKGGLKRTITIRQKKPVVPLTLSGTNYSLASESGSEQSLTITTTKQWAVSGIPSWLSVSPSSGTGNATLILRTLDENYSSKERSGSFSIKAGGNSESVTVNVTQRAALSTAKTTPTNVLPMCFGVSMDFTHTSNVAYFDFQILDEYEIGKYSDRELVAFLKTSDETQRKTPDEGWIVSKDNMATYESTGKDYTIVTVSYDKDNKQGEVVKTKFKTKPHINYADVWAYNLWFGHDNDDRYYAIWSMKGNNYVKSYYTYVVISRNIFMTITKHEYLVAWLIYRELQANNKSHDSQINSSRGYSTSYEHIEGPQLQLGEDVGQAPFDIYNDRYIEIVSWAMDSNNELSGVISDQTIDFADSGAKNKMMVGKEAAYMTSASPKMFDKGNSSYMWFSKANVGQNVKVKRIR